MKIIENPSLGPLNSFQLNARASLMLEIENEEDLISIPGFDVSRDFILGGGSNVVFVDSVPGTIFLNRIKGIEIIDETEDRVLVEVGAGENWHDLVTWSVSRHYSGLENLALIPGLAGAAPLQNIGAYGVELASVLESVTTLDLHSGQWKVFNNEQCQFAYRDSVFKSGQPDRYLITSICLSLQKKFVARIDYADLKKALNTSSEDNMGPGDVFSAVVHLRRKKLPDPNREGNAGSFFKNPVISSYQLESLKSRFSNMPSWPQDQNKAKVSAGWMIEQCGLKGHQHKGAAVSTLHALVIINQGSANGAAVWQLAQQIQRRVQDRFGLLLEPEPKIYLQG